MLHRKQPKVANVYVREVPLWSWLDLNLADACVDVAVVVGDGPAHDNSAARFLAKFLNASAACIRMACGVCISMISMSCITLLTNFTM